MKLEYSSIALKNLDYKDKIKEARTLCEKNDIEFGIQIHNSATLEQLQILSKENIPLSFHAPIGGKHYINLATKNTTLSFKSLEDTIYNMEKYNVKLAVFHGFLMVDSPVSTQFEATSKSYNDILKTMVRNDLLYSRENNPNFITGYFFNTSEYQERFEMLNENLKIIEKQYPEFDICIENDFPCLSFGNILADYISKINHKICLDTGHLFAATVIYKQDFLTEAKKIISTKNVKCTHFHSTLLKNSANPLNIVDGHKNLYINSDLLLKDLLKIMIEHDVNDYIFEISNGDLKDFETFISWKNDICANKSNRLKRVGERYSSV